MTEEEKQKLGRRILNAISRHKTIVEHIETKTEDEIEKVLEDCSEKTTFSQQDNLDAATLVYDFNPIHRHKDTALTFPFVKFTDTPIVGVLPLFTGARIANKVITKLNAVEALRDYWGTENELKVTSRKVAFKNPIYPEQEVTWEFSGAEEKMGEIELTLTGRTKKEPVIEIVTRIGKSYTNFPSVAGPILSQAYEITDKDIETFYRIAKGNKETSQMPSILVASLAPTGLLKLLKEKTGKMEGANMKMNIDYLAEPTAGIAQVDIFAPIRTPRPGSRQIYRMRAVTSQNTKPMHYVELMCATNESIDLSIPYEKRTI